MLIAYDAAGNVIATLEYVVARDTDGKIGLLDLEAIEAAGTPLLKVWNVSGAAGSGVWPGKLEHPHEYRVIRNTNGKIKQLEHKQTKVRLDRQPVAEVGSTPASDR